MRDFPRQARVSLSVYLRRGEVALNELRKGDIDRAMSTLRLRKAAYHNYRAADVISLREGIDVTLEPEVSLTFQQIKAVDVKIEETLTALLNEAEEELVRTLKHKSKLGRYRSGLATSARFEKTV